MWIRSIAKEIQTSRRVESITVDSDVEESETRADQIPGGLDYATTTGLPLATGMGQEVVWRPVDPGVGLARVFLGDGRGYGVVVVENANI